MNWNQWLDLIKTRLQANQMHYQAKADQAQGFKSYVYQGISDVLNKMQGVL